MQANGPSGEQEREHACQNAVMKSSAIGWRFHPYFLAIKYLHLENDHRFVDEWYLSAAKLVPWLPLALGGKVSKKLLNRRLWRQPLLFVLWKAGHIDSLFSAHTLLVFIIWLLFWLLLRIFFFFSDCGWKTDKCRASSRVWQSLWVKVYDTETDRALIKH